MKTDFGAWAGLGSFDPIGRPACAGLCEFVQKGGGAVLLSVHEVRAEWVRAGAFVVATAGWLVMAFAHPRDQTFWWVTGLLISIIGVSGLVWAGLRLPPVRQLFRALLRLRPKEVRSAMKELNRIPGAPAPHRNPRLIAAVFGPLSAIAALVVIVRLAAL